MKKVQFTLISLILIMISFNAKSQMRDMSQLKISLGYSFMGALSLNPAMKFMGPSKMHKIPSLKFESKPIVLELNEYSIYMNSGFGFAPTGFKYLYNSDTTFYYKQSNMQIFAGLGVEYWGLGSGSNEYPLSLTVNGLYASSFYSISYINGILDKGELFPMKAMFGISTRLDMVFLDGNSVDLLVYLNYDRFIGEIDFFNSNTTMFNHTINIGLSMQLEVGLYNSYYF